MLERKGIVPVAADSWDMVADPERSQAVAGCNSQAEDNAQFAEWSWKLWKRTVGNQAGTQSQSRASDSGNTGSRHNSSKPRWK